jgi:adenosylcobyric acid synthase
MIEQLTGRPVLGAVSWIDGLGLDAEDSLSYPDGGLLGRGLPPVGSEWLHVAVPRLPRVSNLTDLDAFAAEPGVQVRLVRSASGVADADLVVIPGSKATVADLGWLRDSGLADAILAHHAAGRPVLGICGGYQMLAESITDEVESGAGTVAGLGLAPLRVAFAAEKTLARPHGTVYGGVRVSGYEIHHGRITHRAAGVPEFVALADGGGEGVRWHADGNGAAGRGAVFGTHWHGAFECDEFRRSFLTEVAGLAGRHGFVVAPDTSYAATRAAALDRMADVVEAELDTFAIRRLLEAGAPAGLPFVPPGAL